MKKYFLFLTILVLTLFSPGIAKAEEIDSCYSKYLHEIDSIIQYPRYYNISSDSWDIYNSRQNYDYTIQALYEIEPNKTYYLKFFTYFPHSYKFIYFYDSNKNFLSNSIYSINGNDLYISFDTSDNFYYFSITFRFGTHDTSKNLPGMSFALADFDLSTCPVIEEPEEPIIPDNPSVEETEQSKILQNFYTLFLDRLKFISDYAINNYLFLAFIGLILVFVILEIFLYLYNKGGYK